MTNVKALGCFGMTVSTHKEGLKIAGQIDMTSLILEQGTCLMGLQLTKSAE